MPAPGVEANARGYECVAERTEVDDDNATCVRAGRASCAARGRMRRPAIRLESLVHLAAERQHLHSGIYLVVSSVHARQSSRAPRHQSESSVTQQRQSRVDG